MRFGGDDVEKLSAKGVFRIFRSERAPRRRKRVCGGGIVLQGPLRSVGEDDFQFANALMRRTVTQPSRPDIVDGKNTADRSRRNVPGTWREERSVRTAEEFVDAFAHRAGLRAHVIVPRLQRALHMTRKIEDDSRTDGGGGTACPRTATMYGKPFFNRVLHDGGNVLRRFGPDDRARTFFKGTSVARIELANDVVAARVPVN